MIGIIDSGIGGLHLLKTLDAKKFCHSTIYVADYAFMPYGKRTAEEIIGRLTIITEFLLTRQCQIIILACNTATTCGLQELRRRFPSTQFIGMEPAIKPAAEKSRNKKIALIATEATLKSPQLKKLIEQFGGSCEFFLQDGHDLASHIEADLDITNAIFEQYFSFVQKSGADTLVLGCSHYTALAQHIKQYFHDSILILHTEEPVFHRLESSLSQLNIKTPCIKKELFFSTGSAVEKQALFSKILGRSIDLKSVDL